MLSVKVFLMDRHINFFFGVQWILGEWNIIDIDDESLVNNELYSAQGIKTRKNSNVFDVSNSYL